MPVVAIAGAVTGASALAAGGLTVFQTIAAIGGIVSGIGAVTGNDTLMKLGAVAGLAGGAGAFAQSKGWIASGSAMGTAGAESASSNIGAMTQSAAPGVEPVVPDVSQAGSNAVEMTGGLEQTGGIGENITSANSLLNPTEPANSLFDAPSANAMGSSSDFNAKDALLARGNEVGRGVETAAASTSIFSRLQGFGKFVKENKELSSIAANFIGGIFDDEKKAKTDYYQAAADATRAKTARGSDVPDMRAKLKQSGPIWKTSSPTYNAPRPSGLFYAR